MRLLRPAIPHRPLSVLALLLALPPAAVFAQASVPTPVLTSIAPLGGRPGASLELTVRGSDLDGAGRLLLSPVSGGPAQTLPVTPVAGKKGLLTVALPQGLPTATYDLRLVGSYGVSNPRVFQVGARPVIESSGSNSKPAAALAVPTDAAVHGVFKAGVPHWFRFDARKGQRVLASFAGAAFDTRVSLVGKVTDDRGRELARLRGGLLDFQAPADGSYRLQVNDLLYAGGDDYGYRLNLTTGPVVWAAAGGLLYGWNLPGGQVLRELRVSQAAPLERLRTDAATAARLLAESPLSVLPAFADEEAPEQAPPAAPTPLQVGQTWSGWFPSHGAARRFDLAFQAGDRFTLEIVSQQAGFPTDPLLVVEAVKKDAAGKETLTLQTEQNDPAVPSLAGSARVAVLDPVYAYEAKAAGVFRITLSDPLNAANGRRHPCQLRVVRAGAPAATAPLALHPALPKAAATGPFEIASANVWRQGIAAVEVLLPGRSALSGPAEVTLDGLPAGVTCLGGFAGPGQSVAYVGLRAAADAPAGAAVLGGLPRTACLTWAVKDSNREVLQARVAGAPAVGVVAQTGPALVETAAATTPEAPVNGKLDLVFKITRHPACTEALKLKLLGFGDPAKAPELSVPAKAAEAKLTLDLKALKLAPGEYGGILQGPAKMPVRRNAEAVTAAEQAAQAAAAAETAAKQRLADAQAALKAGKPDDAAGQAARAAAVKDATAALAQATQTRTERAKAAKDLAAKNPAKDATFTVYSNPIRFRVKEAAKP